MTPDHTSTPQAQSRATHGSNVVWLWLVLGAAVLAVVAPGINSVLNGSSPGDGAGPDLLITPVGWAFSIWGVIYALAIVQAVAAVLASRRHGDQGPRRLQIDQVGLYLGAAAWIALAGIGSSVATAAALAVMAVFAIDGVLAAAGHDRGPVWLTRLTRLSFGLFAGWVSAALFLNIGTALAEQDVFAVDQAGWQLGVVATASVVLAGITSRVGAVIPTYPAAGLWALLGIWVTGSQDHNVDVQAAAVAGGVLVAIAAIYAVMRNRS